MTDADRAVARISALNLLAEGYGAETTYQLLRLEGFGDGGEDERQDLRDLVGDLAANA